MIPSRRSWCVSAGAVTSADGVSEVAAGTPVTGHDRVRAETADFNPADPAQGLYEAISGFSLMLREAGQSAERGVIGVLNDSAQFGGNSASKWMPIRSPPGRRALGRHCPASFSFQVDIDLADPGGTVFSSDAPRLSWTASGSTSRPGGLHTRPADA